MRTVHLRLLVLIATIVICCCSGAAQASPWTEGTKSVLAIRVDFDDLPGEPLTTEAIEPPMNEANEIFKENSYGKFQFGKVTITPTLRMPQTSAVYEAGVDRYKDARDAARAAGYDTNQYDLELLLYRQHAGGGGGVGNIGSKGLVLYNTISTYIVVHEMGHNLGAGHSNSWRTSDGSIIGEGEPRDYGNPFDWMGGGGKQPHGLFNVYLKNRFGWLTDAETPTITQSGLYRIQAHDVLGLQGVRGLRIQRSPGQSYWVEFRQRIEDNVYSDNGAGILRVFEQRNDCQFLDTTPETETADDGPLLVGRTFSDMVAGIHITTLRKSEGAPNTLEVMVNLGHFEGNHAPQVKVEAEAGSVEINGALKFKATGSDADGDELSYFWDFGDGGFLGDRSEPKYDWPYAGDYVVRCTVTDRKGGTASDSVVVHVNDKASRILSSRTMRLSGQITEQGQPLPDVLVEATPNNRAWTNSDGRYTIVNLSPGSYHLKVQKPDYAFTLNDAQRTPLHLPRPIVRGPNTGDVNFLARNTERIAPQLTIDSPTKGVSFHSWPTIAGTARDNYGGSGLDRVEVSIRRDDSFWNGTAWSAEQTWLRAQVNGTQWEYKPAVEQGISLPNGKYTIDAVAYDRAGNGSNPPISGDYITFDGQSDSINLTSLTGLPKDDISHTIELWVKTENMPSNRAWLLLLGSAGTPAHHWLVNSSGTTQFGVSGDNSGQLQPRLKVGEWTHLATNFDGNVLRAYVNGVEIGKTAARFNLYGGPTLPLTLAKAYGGENGFQGSIKEVRLWKGARTESEIMNSMSTSLSGQEKDLILYWRLNTSSETTIPDASGHGNDGQIMGKPIWSAPATTEFLIDNP